MRAASEEGHGDKGPKQQVANSSRTFIRLRSRSESTDEMGERTFLPSLTGRILLAEAGAKEVNEEGVAVFVHLDHSSTSLRIAVALVMISVSSDINA